MKLDVTTPILAIDGTPIWKKPPMYDSKDETKIVKEGEPMLLADVLINAALEPPPPPPPGQSAKGYTGEQHVMRYELAIGAERARKLDPPVVQISAELAATLKKDIERLYRTIVAGQVIPMLDGK